LNKKIVFAIASILVFTVVFLSVPLTLAQDEWDYCLILAYGTNVDETGTAGFVFTVAAPPTGLEIPNTVSVVRDSSGENYTNSLSPGDEVTVSYLDKRVDTMDFASATEANHFVITYEGEARSVTINRRQIPEFSSILILPMFIGATLLAIIYRRKKAANNQGTD